VRNGPLEKSVVFPDVLVIPLDAIVESRLRFDEHVFRPLERQNPVQRRFMRTEPIRDDPLGHEVVIVQRFFGEALGGIRVAVLVQDVRYPTVLVHGSPQSHDLAPHDAQLFLMPNRSQPRSMTFDLEGDERGEFEVPFAQGFVANGNGITAAMKVGVSAIRGVKTAARHMDRGQCETCIDLLLLILLLPYRFTTRECRVHEGGSSRARTAVSHCASKGSRMERLAA
jgi:hypothetical protein